MAISRKEFLLALENSPRVRAIGDAGGKFCVAIERDGKAYVVANDREDGPRYFPSLNHVADWMQRLEVQHFVVDISLWRKSDTGRAQGAMRP